MFGNKIIKIISREINFFMQYDISLSGYESFMIMLNQCYLWLIKWP